MTYRIKQFSQNLICFLHLPIQQLKLRWKPKHKTFTEKNAFVWDVGTHFFFRSKNYSYAHLELSSRCSSRTSSSADSSTLGQTSVDVPVLQAKFEYENSAKEAHVLFPLLLSYVSGRQCVSAVLANRPVAVSKNKMTMWPKCVESGKKYINAFLNRKLSLSFCSLSTVIRSSYIQKPQLLIIVKDPILGRIF